MARHHTISYPRKWIKPTTRAGKRVSGYWQPPYQLDVPFASDEEVARDAEEAAWVVKREANRITDARKSELQAKLAADTVTLAELREMLRLERRL